MKSSRSSELIEDSRPWRRWSSFFLSLGFHVLVLVSLVILLGLKNNVGGGPPDIRRVDVVLTNVTEQNQEEYLDEEDFESESTDTAQLLSDSAPVESLTELPEVQPQQSPALQLPQLDATGFTQMPTQANTGSKRIELSQADKEMIEADRARFAAEAAQGSETSLEVFGSGKLTGRKFIFVLDRSKSMGSQGLGVLDRASQQLAEAIDTLEPHHKFQVIAYHHRTTPLIQRRLLRATDENKQQVEGFIGDLAAFGSTQHESALIVALAMNPDVVVLLTDGGLPELNQGQLTNIRRAVGRAQIHCIQFGSGPRQQRGGFMVQLAAENDGSYRYVDVTQWKD